MLRAVAIVAVVLGVATPAAVAKKPDLKISSVSPGAASVSAGADLEVADTTKTIRSRSSCRTTAPTLW
jgi:hypothetical protein